MIKKFFLSVFLLSLILFVYLSVVIYGAGSALDKNIEFEIKQGESVNVVVENLKIIGLLDHPFIFKNYLKWRGLDKKIQPGFFVFEKKYSLRDLSEIISAGNISERLTFLEGWTLREYGYYLENKGLHQAEELHEVVGFPAVDYRLAKDLPVLLNWEEDFSFLQDKPKFVGLEGYLFPDTYFIAKGVKIEDIIIKMLSNFDKKLNADLRAEIKKQNKTIFQIVTVASLIEAEAAKKEDRQLVSDIIWRRLGVNMPLQLDSTVNYVTGYKKPAISLNEQTIDSFYNTYKYKGLPLGPINNPSLESILSSIYPKKNKYWYFLTGKDGQMYYAEDLAGHNLNKNRYLR